MQAIPFDNFEIGQVIDTYGRTITEADIVSFTCVTGIKLPVFTDDHFCRKHTPYGGRITPGLLTASYAVGMMEGVLGANILAALQLDKFVFKKIVKPGATLRTRVTILEKRDTSDGVRGVMKVGVGVINEHDDEMATFEATFLMRKEVVEY